MRNLTVTFGLMLLLVPVVSTAQQDTTPPVLLDFALAPSVVDASSGTIAIDGCITASDNLSGLRTTNIFLIPPGSGTAIDSDSNNAFIGQDSCFDLLVPQFAPFGVYTIVIEISDFVGNESRYATGGVNNGDDLCALVNPCQVENRPAAGLPDADDDNVPDDADNCPDDANPGQEDADLDLVGDVCDPFANDRDNEKAQCFADLTQAQDNLAICQDQLIFQDDDADGIEDSNDVCLSTPAGVAVDGVGCSRAEFCARRPAHFGVCSASDWRNDEPLSILPGDCKFQAQACVEDQGAPACALGPGFVLVLPGLVWAMSRRRRGLP